MKFSEKIDNISNNIVNGFLTSFGMTSLHKHIIFPCHSERSEESILKTLRIDNFLLFTFRYFYVSFQFLSYAFHPQNPLIEMHV